ncbi:hypothetical protein [Paenibacillus sp. GCM10027626]|uniref:hypothetical protein n=1 Tax=Paenibacillus sp. GCM10027626 TaxID=3273411 RepID=UPI00363A3B4B
MNDYTEKILKSGRTFLSRWQQANACVWEYHLSHTTITFRLEKPGVIGNLHIACIEPILYSGKFKWNNCCFQVNYNEEKQLYILTDKQNEVSIECEAIEFKENCKPIF